MSLPTALAPTVDLATPKVEKFAERLREYFGVRAEISDFYKCEPSTFDVEDREGHRWVEGSWGLNILSDRFASDTLEEIQHLSRTIDVNEATVYPKGNKLEVRLWLSARVMRG